MSISRIMASLATGVACSDLRAARTSVNATSCFADVLLVCLILGDQPGVEKS